MKTSYTIVMDATKQFNFLEKYKKYCKTGYEKKEVKLNFLLNRIKSLQKQFTFKLKEMQTNLENEIEDDEMFEFYKNEHEK